MKHTKSSLVVNSKMAAAIERKKDTCRQYFKSTKQIQFALITNQPIKANAWSEETFDSVIDVSRLF